MHSFIQELLIGYHQCVSHLLSIGDINSAQYIELAVYTENVRDVATKSN